MTDDITDTGPLEWQRDARPVGLYVATGALIVAVAAIAVMVTLWGGR